MVHESYNDVKILFGPYKNTLLNEVPAAYLLTLLKKGNLMGHLKNYVVENKDLLIQEVKTNENTRIKNFN